MNTSSKNLKGHSGCSIALVDDLNQVYVSKTSPEKGYNFRLKKQCLKQLKFCGIDIKAPKVFKSGYIEDKFYFNMEYIKGKTLAECFYDIDVNKIPKLSIKLFNNLYIENAVKSEKANLIFSKKIQDLQNKLYNFPNLKPSFDILNNFDWSNVLKSPCHGDLTLENILISTDEQIFLIDFLDSFYNSWMLDIAKLLQDLELKWSFRKLPDDSNRNLRLFLAKKYLLDEFGKIQNGDNILNTIYHLLLLNIVRIFPYTNDSHTLNFLNNALEIILKRITERKEEVYL